MPSNMSWMMTEPVTPFSELISWYLNWVFTYENVVHTYLKKAYIIVSL
ncbi:hypothetical protein ABXV18_24425 [Vibrio owensii]